MRPTRRSVVLGLGAAAATFGCGGGWRSKAEDGLARGSRALWKLQSPDGAFRSARYGLLSDGWSLTPFALLALLRTGEALDTDGASRAFGWIVHGTRDGVLGLAGSAPDYPCYATALALHSFAIVRPPGSEPAIEGLRTALKGFQLRAPEWEGTAAAGAFRMGSTDVPHPPHSGHVDLSMTRRAVEALVASGVPVSDDAVVQAVGFAERCRTPLGAFVYTATETALNKGRRGDKDPGYGTATADGLLLLAAAGVRTEAFERGLTQLKQMHRIDQNPLVGDGPFQPYGKAMRGYYRSASARAFALAGGPGGWERALATAVLAEQLPDGSWANEQGEQKEDEPLIATGFALQALAACLHRGPEGR